MGTIPQYSVYGAVGSTYALFSDGLTQQPGTFYNAGQLNISPGTNIITIDDTLINTGNVYVNPGTLNLGNGGTNYGGITVAPAATLQFSIYPVFNGSEYLSAYPVFTFNAGSLLNNAGNLLFGGPANPSQPKPGDYGNGAYMVNIAGTVSVAGSNIFGLGETYPTTVNLTGNYSTGNPLIFSGAVVANFNSPGLPSPPALTMRGGTLSNTFPMVIQGPFNCSGGTIAGVVQCSGPLNWSGGKIQGVVQCNGGTLTNGPCYLDGGQLINVGTLAWTKVTVDDGAGSVISNAPGATINLAVSGAVTASGYSGAATFYNAGLLNVLAGPSAATLHDNFINTGTVSLNAGTFAPSGTYQQTAALTLLNGGSMQNTVGLQIQGGTLGGSGTITGSVTNSGTVSPGTPLGKISIGGTYVQTSGGTLDIDLGGTVAGISYDLLAVTGKATLAGNLNVGLTNGYFPANTNTLFKFLTASSRTGTFASFSYPSSQLGMQIDYATNSASIQVTNLGQVLAPVTLMAPGYTNGHFTMTVGAAAGPYVIETSTNLVQWVSLFTNLSPAVPFQFSDPAAGNFGTRFYRVRQAQ
jgi:hypothetical protein